MGSNLRGLDKVKNIFQLQSLISASVRLKVQHPRIWDAYAYKTVLLLRLYNNKFGSSNHIVQQHPRRGFSPGNTTYKDGTERLYVEKYDSCFPQVTTSSDVRVSNNSTHIYSSDSSLSDQVISPSTSSSSNLRCVNDAPFNNVTSSALLSSSSSSSLSSDANFVFDQGSVDEGALVAPLSHRCRAVDNNLQNHVPAGESCGGSCTFRLSLGYVGKHREDDATFDRGEEGASVITVSPSDLIKLQTSFSRNSSFISSSPLRESLFSCLCGTAISISQHLSVVKWSIFINSMLQFIDGSPHHTINYRHSASETPDLDCPVVPSYTPSSTHPMSSCGSTLPSAAETHAAEVVAQRNQVVWTASQCIQSILVRSTAYNPVVLSSPPPTRDHQSLASASLHQDAVKSTSSSSDRLLASKSYESCSATDNPLSSSHHEVVDLHSLSVIVSSFARLGYVDDDLFSCVIDYVQEDQSLLTSATPADLSMMLSALGKLALCPASGFLDILTRCILSKLSSFSPNQLSITLHSYVKVTGICRKLLSTSCRPLTHPSTGNSRKDRPSGDMTGHNVSALNEASDPMAVHANRSASLVSAICHGLEDQVTCLSPQSIALIFHSLAQLLPVRSSVVVSPPPSFPSGTDHHTVTVAPLGMSSSVVYPTRLINRLLSGAYHLLKPPASPSAACTTTPDVPSSPAALAHDNRNAVGISPNQQRFRPQELSMLASAVSRLCGLTFLQTSGLCLSLSSQDPSPSSSDNTPTTSLSSSQPLRCSSSHVHSGGTLSLSPDVNRSPLAANSSVDGSCMLHNPVELSDFFLCIANTAVRMLSFKATSHLSACRTSSKHHRTEHSTSSASLSLTAKTRHSTVWSSTFSAHHLSVLLRSFARVGMYHEPMFKACAQLLLSNSCRLSAADLNPQDVSDLILVFLDKMRQQIVCENGKKYTDSATLTRRDQIPSTALSAMNPLQVARCSVNYDHISVTGIAAPVALSAPHWYMELSRALQLATINIFRSQLTDSQSSPQPARVDQVRLHDQCGKMSSKNSDGIRCSGWSSAQRVRPTSADDAEMVRIPPRLFCSIASSMSNSKNTFPVIWHLFEHFLTISINLPSSAFTALHSLSVRESLSQESSVRAAVKYCAPRQHIPYSPSEVISLVRSFRRLLATCESLDVMPSASRSHKACSNIRYHSACEAYYYLPKSQLLTKLECKQKPQLGTTNSAVSCLMGSQSLRQVGQRTIRLLVRKGITNNLTSFSLTDLADACFTVCRPLGPPLLPSESLSLMRQQRLINSGQGAGNAGTVDGSQVEHASSQAITSPMLASLHDSLLTTTSCVPTMMPFEPLVDDEELSHLGNQIIHLCGVCRTYSSSELLSASAPKMRQGPASTVANLRDVALCVGALGSVPPDFRKTRRLFGSLFQWVLEDFLPKQLPRKSDTGYDHKPTSRDESQGAVASVEPSNYSQSLWTSFHTAAFLRGLALAGPDFEESKLCEVVNRFSAEAARGITDDADRPMTPLYCAVMLDSLARLQCTDNGLLRSIVCFAEQRWQCLDSQTAVWYIHSLVRLRRRDVELIQRLSLRIMSEHMLSPLSTVVCPTPQQLSSTRMTTDLVEVPAKRHIADALLISTIRSLATLDISLFNGASWQLSTAHVLGSTTVSPKSLLNQFRGTSAHCAALAISAGIALCLLGDNLRVIVDLFGLDGEHRTRQEIGVSTEAYALSKLLQTVSR
eukprot:GHVQ01024442.1.p1 GENE.GHVQ01024442.1~~GHVQ01024442.1.p1  ORF type:complete len:1711 (+),score=189.62 GHVQ01024442.1:338-5470(+)